MRSNSLAERRLDHWSLLGGPQRGRGCPSPLPGRAENSPRFHGLRFASPVATSRGAVGAVQVFSKLIRTHPDSSELIRTHPDSSGFIRIHPNWAGVWPDEWMNSSKGC